MFVYTGGREHRKGLPARQCSQSQNMILNNEDGIELSLLPYTGNFLTELAPPVLSEPKERRKRNMAARHDRDCMMEFKLGLETRTRSLDLLAI